MVSYKFLHNRLSHGNNSNILIQCYFDGCQLHSDLCALGIFNWTYKVLYLFILFEGKHSSRSNEAFFQESDSEQEEGSVDGSGTFKIDDWILFTADDPALYTVAMLRVKFLVLFTKHIQIPSKSWSEADDAIVKCIANILTKEEQAVGLTNPATRDIEQRISYERRADRYYLV